MSCFPSVWVLLPSVLSLFISEATAIPHIVNVSVEYGEKKGLLRGTPEFSTLEILGLPVHCLHPYAVRELPQRQASRIFFLDLAVVFPIVNLATGPKFPLPGPQHH